MEADALPIARTVEGALGENQVRADAGKGSWPREVMARIVRGTATGFVQPSRAAGSRGCPAGHCGAAVACG